MTKIEFLLRLEEKMAGISCKDRTRTIDYYSEIIDDKIEDGMTEEEAVSTLDDADDIVKRVFMEIPLIDIVKENLRPKRRLKTWEIVTLVAGFPVWLPLIISAFAVAFSLWVTMYAVIISFYAVALSLAVGSLGALVVAIINLILANIPSALIMVSFSFVSAGLAPLLFFGLNKLTKLTFVMNKNIIYGIKKFFTR